jgi:sodium/proline symporter
VGGITVVIWKQLSGGLYDLYEIVPGILFATLAIIIASLITSAPPASVQTRFDVYRSKL